MFNFIHVWDNGRIGVSRYKADNLHRNGYYTVSDASKRRITRYLNEKMKFDNVGVMYGHIVNTYSEDKS